MSVFIFICCAVCGVISGVVYDVLYIVRCAVCGVRKEAYTVKDRIFTVVCDVLYFIALAAMFVFVSVLFEFEGLRMYMPIGCLSGVLLYLKSVHILVAISVNKVYNIVTESIRKRKNDG